MIQSDKWILEIRGMRSRKSNRIVQDNQSSLARYIQCSNTACDTRTKTPQLIQKKKSQQSSRLDIGNQKYHQSMKCDFVN